MPLILVYRETFVSFAYVVNLWSCWNSGYELDIVATTRSKRVHQSFSFVSFSLSTELLEDKQGFKLGGVDTSILHHVFMLIFIAPWAIISLHGTILMPFLSYFERFTWRGRMPAAGILAWKWSKFEIPILRNSKHRKNQWGFFPDL